MYVGVLVVGVYGILDVSLLFGVVLVCFILMSCMIVLLG